MAGKDTFSIEYDSVSTTVMIGSLDHAVTNYWEIDTGTYSQLT